MRSSRKENGLRGLDALLRVGTAVGLTDGQLLECFAERSGEASERAFAVLVDRHGPMVLRTCRSILRDENDARDAFQASFLILARRGGSLWVRDSIGPWLHRVARRAAIRARRVAERRRVVERGAALAADRSQDPSPAADVADAVHEEVDRLPERYRVPVVLCDLEGRTHEDAARHIGCPVGTVKSRLARARSRLRDRLTRRGLAPGIALSESIRAALPVELLNATTAMAARGATAEAGPLPASVGEIIRDVSRSMFLAHLGSMSVRIIMGLTIGAGLVLFGAGVRSRQVPNEKPPAPAPAIARAAPPAGAAPEYAWRRTDRYEPPDFSGYFPDDPEGGKALDRLWEDEAGRDKRPVDEIFRTVRRGMRRTSAPRDRIIDWVGQRFIWGASPQDPLAIEMLYHATDSRGPLTMCPESPSIYYGLMRVEPKTPAILHALVDWCMHVENTMDWYWAGWIGRKYRSELAADLESYLQSRDEATRKRAVVVGKYLSESPDR